jgi:hypothetical protein
MTYKFAVGQIVDLMQSKLRPAASGGYEILRQMPELDSGPGNPRYRIKSVDEKHERVANERELTLAGEPAPVFS